MRKVEIGNAILYNGDCREVIPLLGAHAEGLAVVSDLPYGIEDMVGGYGRDGRTIMNDKNLDVAFGALRAAADTFRDFRTLAFYSCRITDQFFAAAAWKRDGGDDAPHIGRYVGEIIWDKKAPGMGNPIRYSHENVAIFEKGMPAYPMGETFSIVVDMRAPTLHPHQKPPLLMETLVNVAGAPVVLDPFMGSGSTGVAALKTGRKFIGIELDPKHFETAVARVREADATPGLWT